MSSSNPGGRAVSVFLTRAQILKLIELTQEVEVVGPSEGFPFRVTRRGSGWSDDAELGAIQASLSVSLEVASKMERS